MVRPCSAASVARTGMVGDERGQAWIATGEREGSAVERVKVCVGRAQQAGLADVVGERKHLAQRPLVVGQAQTRRVVTGAQGLDGDMGEQRGTLPTCIQDDGSPAINIDHALPPPLSPQPPPRRMWYRPRRAHPAPWTL